MSRDPSEEDGGANLYGFVGNDPTDGADPLGLVGGVIGNRPFTAQEVDGARNRAFQLITYFGGVGEGLPQKLLRQWLWKRGDYTLTDAEFNETAWGDKNYHAIHPTGVSSDQVGLLSLNMIPEFKSDLESKCSKGGETFKGSYMILDYANTGRTLGSFFWYVDVSVKCGCKKGDYNASGQVR